MYYSEPLRRTFIIIPAFNENDIISGVVEELLPLGCPIVIVDDGSSEELRTQFSGKSQFYYIRHKVNLGQGAALQTGIDFALKQGASWFITFDADGQHSAKDIPALLAPLFMEQADIVLASRFSYFSLDSTICHWGQRWRVSFTTISKGISAHSSNCLRRGDCEARITTGSFWGFIYNISDQV